MSMHIGNTYLILASTRCIFMVQLFKQFTGLSPLIVFNLWCPQNQTFSHKDVWTCHLKNLGRYTTRAVFASLRKTKTKQYTHTCTHGARTHIHTHTHTTCWTTCSKTKQIKDRKHTYLVHSPHLLYETLICVTLPTDSHEHHKQIASSASASSTSFPVQNRSSQAKKKKKKKKMKERKKERKKSCPDAICR